MSGSPPSASAPPESLLRPGLQLARCRYGLMLYRANDKFIGRSYQVYGEMNELEIRALCGLFGAGDTVLDVGANIGVNAIPFALRAGPQGKVVAFEPQRIVHQMLCANLALNGIANVVAHWAAAGAVPGSINVPPVDYEAVDNFGGISLGGAQGEAVPVMTVDGLALKDCRLIKIDVEGMELEVLKGSADTIARLRPRLYMENNRQELSAALIGHLLGLGYRLYWHLPALFNPANFRGEQRNLWPKVVSVNMLGLPPGDTLQVGRLRPILSPNDWWKAAPSGKA